MKIKIIVFLFAAATQLNAGAQNNGPKAKAVLYQFFQSVKLSTRFQSFGIESRDTTLLSTVAGQIKLHVVHASDSGILIYGKVTSIKSMVNPLPAAATEALKMDMENGCQFFQGNAGLITSVQFITKPSEAGEAFWIQFLQYFQCSRTPAILTIETADAALLATFVKGENLHEIKLEHLEAEEETAAPRAIGKYYLFEPTIRYLFDRDLLWPLSVNGFIKKFTRVNHRSMIIQTDSFSVKKIGDEEHVNIINKEMAYSRTIFAPEKAALRKTEKLFKKSNELSVQGIIQQLRQNDNDKDDIRKDDLVEATRICFETRKDSLFLIRDEFLHSPENTYSFKTIRAALVGAGTDTAQAYLVDYIDAYKSNCNKIRKLVSATGLIQKPGFQIQMLLEAIAFDNNFPQDCAAAAQLALGNLSGNLQYSNKHRGDSLTLLLCRRLYRNADTLQVLSVLGNTNSNVILPFIYPYLSAVDPVIRGYALYALRFAANDTVGIIFKNALQDETDSTVISSVLQALYYRKFNPEHFKLVDHIITSYPSVKTRLQALQLVEQWSYRRLFLEEYIRKYAVFNSMPAITAQAKTIVQQFER